MKLFRMFSSKPYAPVIPLARCDMIEVPLAAYGAGGMMKKERGAFYGGGIS